MGKKKKLIIHKKVHKKVKSRWRRWPFKHTTLLAFGIVALVLLLDTAIVAGFFAFLENASYLGAFIGGFFYVSAFTAAAAIIILFSLGGTIPIVPAAFIAAIGGVIADYLILRFMEDSLAKEIRLLAYRAKMRRFIYFMKRKKLRPLLRLFGLFILASPFPDEAGLAMLDVSKLSKTKILLVAFTANLVGVFLVLYAGSVATR